MRYFVQGSKLVRMRVRCDWVPPGVDEYIAYHDQEWGVPLHDEHRFFELLCLEGAQAGLSWLTVLRKRDAYRIAFDGFDPEKVARYDAAKVAELLANPGIIRNRLKVASAIRNARAFLEIQEKRSSFDSYIWRFVEGRPVINEWSTHTQFPATTPLSDLISRELKGDGFNFVGSTIVYALLQSAGLVNDHTMDCFRRSVCSSLS